MVAKREKVGKGMEWEFGVSRCKLMYMEWINKCLVIRKTLGMTGTTFICESTFSTVNFLESKYWRFVFLLRRNKTLRSSAHVLIGCFCCCWVIVVHELFVLEIKPLWVTLFANIFFHSISCLFIWSVVSFAVRKLVSLIRSHLFVFAFISIASGDWVKKTLVQFISEHVCLWSRLGVSWCHVLMFVFKPFWVYFCVCWEGIF